MRKILIIFLGCSISLCTLSGQVKTIPIALEVRLIREYVKTFDKDWFDNRCTQSYFEIPGDSAFQHFYDIEIIIENKSTDPIYVWLMSCSWTDNFIINNDYIYIDGVPECDANRPISVQILPGQKSQYFTSLRKDIKFDYPGPQIFGYGVEETKLGLIVVNDVFQNRMDYRDYSLGMWDRSKWEIIWSNQLKLHDFGNN